MHFLFDLSIRNLEANIISVVNFLCLFAEILKDKDTSHPPSWIFTKSMTSHKQGNIFSFRSN